MTKAFKCYLLLAIAAVSTFLTQSCVESYPFEIDNGIQQIVLISEFSSTKNFCVELTTSISSCCPSEISIPSNADIELYNTSGIVTKLTFDQEQQKYFAEPKLNPEGGQLYSIRAKIDNTNISPVSSCSQIPEKIRIEEIQLMSFDSIGQHDHFKYFIEIDIKIEEPAVLPTYFHLSANRDKNKLFIDPETLERTITYLDEHENITIDKFLQDKNAFHLLNHLNGALVDYSKLTENTMRLKLYTDRAISINTEYFHRMNFSLYSVTKDYYDFHKAISHSSSVSGATIPQPISIPSNIENGLGLFAGVNLTLKSLTLR